MTSEVEIKHLLHELKKRAGSNKRLAKWLDVDVRNLGPWLKMTEEELSNRRPATLDRIRELAKEHHITPHYRSAAPLWNWRLPYSDNIECHPDPPPLHSLEPCPTKFLGRLINSPFGASASPITSTASRIRYLAMSGNDVITYMTVQASEVRPYGHPNIFMAADENYVWSPDDGKIPSVLAVASSHADTTGSGLISRLGPPCGPAQIWQADFATARSSLLPGQMLLLSVMSSNHQRFVDDFVECAKVAVKLGADAIELHLGHPCFETGLPPCKDIRLSKRICKAAADAKLGKPVVAKISYMGRRVLEQFVDATAPFVAGYTAIAGLPVHPKQESQHGLEPVFGEGAVAALSGRPIFKYGLKCVQQLADIRAQRDAKDLVIIGVGGVTSPTDINMYLDSGADVVQAATIFFRDSLFGLKAHNVIRERFSRSHMSNEMELHVGRYNWTLAAHELEEEWSKNDEIRKQVRLSAAAEILAWQNESAKVTTEKKRRSAVPTTAEFKERIRLRLLDTKAQESR